MEYRLDQSAYLACQIACLNMLIGEPVLPDNATESEDGGNG